MPVNTGDALSSLPLLEETQDLAIEPARESDKTSQRIGKQTLGRIPLVFNNLLTSYLRARQHTDIVAAGSLCDTCAYLFYGTVKFAAANTGVYINNHLRKKRDQELKQNEATATRELSADTEAYIHNEIGDLLWSCWISWAFIAMLPAAVLTLSAGKLFMAAGIQKAIADQAQYFLFGYSIGVPAVMGFTCDTSYMGGCTKEYDTTIFNLNLTYGLLTIGFNILFYLLDLGSFGLGFSFSLPGILLAIATRIILYQNKQLSNQHKLFELQRGFLGKFWTRFTELAPQGMYLGLQNIAEWGNLLAISLFLGTQSKNALIAMQVALSSIWVTYSYYILALGQSTSNLISSDWKLQRMDKVKKTVRISLIWTIFSSLIPVTFAFAFPNQLTNLFTHGNTSQNAKNLAKEFLWVSAPGYLLDALRITITYQLSGMKHSAYALLTNTGLISLLSLPVSIALVLYYNLDLVSMLISREVGITLALVCLAHRIYQKSSSYENSLDKSISLCGVRFFIGQTSAPSHAEENGYSAVETGETEEPPQPS